MRRRMIAVQRLLKGVPPVDVGGIATRSNRPRDATMIYAGNLVPGWTCYAWEEHEAGGITNLVVTIHGVGPNGLREVLRRRDRNETSSDAR